MADNKGNAGDQKPANSAGKVTAPKPLGQTCNPKKSTGGDLRAKGK